MPATETQPPSDVASGQKGRSPLRRALDFVFGYDFFVSYTWSDGAAYANALAGRLESEGFEVFLDRNNYASGDDWKKVGAWTLRRTGQLILVGSPAALQSAPVLREVEIFSRTGRRIVPIDFAGSLEWKESGSALAQLLPAEILRIKEPASALESGPSGQTITTLRRTFNLVRQDKKRIRAFAVIAVLLLVLSIASTGFAFFAELQREKAERRLDMAINIASGVVDKAVALTDRYGVPKDAIGDLLDWADDSFGDLAKEGLSDHLKQARANNLMVFSGYYGQLGKADRQLRAAQQAFALLAPMVEANPENDSWRNSLSMIYDRIGEAHLARGNLAGALDAQRAALMHNERLLAGRPSDPERQRSVSVSQERIGTVLRLQGKLQDALSVQKTAFSIAERRAAERPDELEPQRDLAVSHEKIGELLELLDESKESIASHRAALRIRFDLAQRHPENTALQRELEVSYNKIGQMLLASKELSEAREAHQAALEIAKRLSESDRINAEWQHDLAGAHLWLGDVLYEQNKRAEALSAYENSLAILERLVAANPQQAIYRFGLAGCRERLGDVQLDMGQVDAAIVSYETKRDIAAELVARDPDSGEFQRDLLIAHVKIGDALRRKAGNVQAVRESYLNALKIAKEMQASGRLNPQDAWMVTNLQGRVER